MSDTRVYKYGLLPPTQRAALVEEQLQRAHRYYNELIAAARGQWAAEQAAQLAHSTALATAQAARDAASTALQEALASARAARQRTRTREVSQAHREAVAAWRATLSSARAEMKAARLALRDDVVCQAVLAGIRERAGVWRRAARAHSGLYWGTYLIVEQAVEAAVNSTRKVGEVPRFKRWTGDAAIAVELVRGAPVSAIIGDTDTRVRVTTTPEPIPGRNGKPRPRLWLRVGSTPERGPVWAEWPIILHRPLPDTATIHWVRVIRRMVAGRAVWKAHITLRLAPGYRTEACGTGLVAVDIGWRQEDAGMRVGYCLDERGAGQPLLVEPRTFASLDKAASLRGFRDRDLDLIRATLGTARAMGGGPDWWREATATLHAWKSPARFFGLWRRWGTARWEGDAAWFEALTWWRSRERHLWQYETGMRGTAIRRRDDYYRNLAAGLARRYDTLVIEALDLRTFARRPKAEEGAATEGGQLRAQRTQAAPSRLRSALVQAFRARSGTVIEVPAAYTTIRCADCGDVDETWDRARELRHTCRACGVRWDQDANACGNLLQAARERRGDGRTPDGRGESAELPAVVPAPRGRFQRRRLAARKRSENQPDAVGLAASRAQ